MDNFLLEITESQLEYTLQSLSLSNVEIGEKQLTYLPRLSSLMEISISNSDIISDDLVMALKADSGLKLEKISLVDVDINTDVKSSTINPKENDLTTKNPSSDRISEVLIIYDTREQKEIVDLFRKIALEAKIMETIVIDNTAQLEEVIDEGDYLSEFEDEKQEKKQIRLKIFKMIVFGAENLKEVLKAVKYDWSFEYFQIVGFIRDISAFNSYIIEKDALDGNFGYLSLFDHQADLDERLRRDFNENHPKNMVAVPRNNFG